MPSPRKNRVKLIDIAQATGVSLTAVSLALSDKPGISKETRVRVLEMARSLGYRFKTPVVTSPVKPIKTVGLLVKSGLEDEPHTNHFYSHIIAGVESICRQMGINMMYANLPVNSENYPLEIPPLLEKGEVDGMLLAGAFVDENLSRILDRRSCPLVLIDSYSNSRVYNAVLSDNVFGAYQATEYLIRKGHRQIGFVGGHEHAYPSFRDRRSGYLKALAEFEIGQPYFADCSVNRSDIANAVQKLVAQNRQITGLVCVNDDTAISAMYSLIEAGIRVPQDISIIGFDDIYLAESVVPSLTTMRVNKQSMGRLAVQLLINQMFQAEGGAITSIFRPCLIERNSVVEACKGERDGEKCQVKGKQF
jgi:LacI family transcriptional regulator